MFYLPVRRGRRFVADRCDSCGPEQPGRQARGKARCYNSSTGRWEWRYCY
ncbi:hypothetical protein HUN08_00075 [Gordonia sp. X0973]|nr:hypothetical protein [Gordonia sp. X0973]QKT05776.1 hypothetical protein HUN08_00075 [Gordonia sp. X0973]